MKYTIDTHTHTLVSGHAYNTIDEMAAYAAGIGVTHLAITDHAPKMPGSAGILYFSNTKEIKEFIINVIMKNKSFNTKAIYVDENNKIIKNLKEYIENYDK